jgi:hypothetical protein
MANIPTAQIPNVQTAVGNEPMADVGAVRVPRFEQMPVLRREVFEGAGAGLVELSRGVWEGAQFLSDFSSKMSAANDDAQYAAADRAFSEAIAAHEVEASRLPPDKHVGLWESKYLPKLQTQIDGIKASGDGRARINAMFQRQAGNAYAAISVGANQKFLESARQESDAFLERAINEGRHEDAYAQLERDRQSNLRSGGEVEQRMVKIGEDHKINTWRGYIQKSPAEARKVLRDAQTTGKPPKGLRPEQVMQFRREAEGQHGQLLQDVTNEILTGLESNAAQISNDEIEKQMTRPDIDAPRELIDKIKERRDFAYSATPEGKAQKDAAYSNMWQRIFAYDAEKDVSLSDPDSHKREYQKLLQDIVDVAPEGERKPFMDTLNERVSNAAQGRKSRADEIAKGLTDMTEKLANWEQLGPIGKWKEVKMGDKTEKVPADMAAYQKVQAKRMEITNDIRAMLRENPELTEEQAMERFKSILENRLDGGAQFMKEPETEEAWWEKLRPFVRPVIQGIPAIGQIYGPLAKGPMANNPNVVAAGISWGSSSLTEGLIDEDLPEVQSQPPRYTQRILPDGTLDPMAPLNGATAPSDFDIANMPPTQQPIASKIASMAEQEGLGQYTPHLMLLVAQESNFNPKTTISTSSARGLFQLLDADRKRYGSDSSLDGQIRAGLAKTKENLAAAKRALGRDPDPFELYVVHYQGIGAGPQILKNPDEDFRATLDRTGGKGHASRVIRANSWLSEIKTNQDFIDWVRQRLSAKAASLGMA